MPSWVAEVDAPSAVIGIDVTGQGRLGIGQLFNGIQIGRKCMML
nr:hypothetical protein [Reticulibacter mediterranei]